MSTALQFFKKLLFYSQESILAYINQIHLLRHIARFSIYLKLKFLGINESNFPIENQTKIFGI